MERGHQADYGIDVKQELGTEGGGYPSCAFGGRFSVRVFPCFSSTS